MPNFDIRFLSGQTRWRVIEYVREKYGAQAVSRRSQRLARWPPRPLSAMRAVCSIFLHSFRDQLSKLIPVVQNKPLSLVKAREAEPAIA
jgi:DNA polymerase-3 subunit alpha